MRPNKQIEDINVFMCTCAWCNKNIDETDEVFCVEAKTKRDLREQEGQIVKLLLEKTGRRISGMIVTGDSQAKLKGYDIAFMVCGPNCGKFLKKMLTEETGIIERV